MATPSLKAWLSRRSLTSLSIAFLSGQAVCNLEINRACHQLTANTAPMRAFLVEKLGHPSELSLSANVPEPRPNADRREVLIDVYSAGLNFFDSLKAQGKHQHRNALPFVLGHEFAGRVASDSPIPDGCPFRRGDRVFGGSQGAFGEKMVCRWDLLLPLPSWMSFDQGAGIYITWPTGYEALVGRAKLQPGEWVLVAASVGGVGMAAVQIAKAVGAKTIALASTQRKLSVAKQFGGADYVVNYTAPGWQQEVLKITGGRGVDVVFDPVGIIRDSMKCLAFKGRAVIVGFAGGKIEQIPMNLVLLKNISLVGLYWGTFEEKEPDHVRSVWNALFEMFSSGQIKPVIYPESYRLEDVVKGLGAIERRETWGKPVIRVREDNERAKL